MANFSIASNFKMNLNSIYYTVYSNDKGMIIINPIQLLGNVKLEKSYQKKQSAQTLTVIKMRSTELN